MLSGETQRRVLPRYHSEEMKILNILLPLVRIEPTTVASTVTRFCYCAMTASFFNYTYKYKNKKEKL